MIHKKIIIQHFNLRGKLGLFLIAGLPSFMMSVPLNWFLAEKLAVHKSIAYAIVMCFQLSVNFFMCRMFVFRNRRETSVWVQFSQFAAGIFAFRIADWCVYSFFVSVCGFYYIAVQFANVFLFALLKFKFSQSVMEAKQ